MECRNHYTLMRNVKDLINFFLCKYHHICLTILYFLTTFLSITIRRNYYLIFSLTFSFSLTIDNSCFEFPIFFFSFPFHFSFILPEKKKQCISVRYWMINIESRSISNKKVKKENKNTKTQYLDPIGTYLSKFFYQIKSPYKIKVKPHTVKRHILRLWQCIVNFT